LNVKGVPVWFGHQFHSLGRGVNPVETRSRHEQVQISLEELCDDAEPPPVPLSAIGGPFRILKPTIQNQCNRTWWPNLMTLPTRRP
jgi:hypothetical protein